MNDPDRDELRERVDDYLAEMLDEAGTRRLEERLLADAEARAWFVRYCQLHTDLHLLMRARSAGDRAVRRLGLGEAASPRLAPEVWRPVRRIAAVAAVAACLLLATSLTWWLARRGAPPAALPNERVAWLVNAQNCQWAEDMAPLDDLRSGRIVDILSGLAEIRFSGGASVILEGPAALELLSAGQARLRHGRLAAHVPDAAKGFEILSPQGRVVDLGTEFGLAVSEDGSAAVHVFAGKVQAQAADVPAVVDVSERQWAQIAARGVTVQSESPAGASPPFVRQITLPPAIVPRQVTLDFRQPVSGTLRDRSGLGTGLTHRLPGTGTGLHPHDSSLRLDTQTGALELTTTKSDINMQDGMGEGEYLGVRLADLGFTGDEDFEITVTVPNIPALHTVGQFGLYAGSRSDRNIRGGLISREEPQRYGQFLVNNDGGRDSDLHVVGLLSSGDDLKLSLRRMSRRYSLSVENQSTGSSSTLNIRHPAFLDGEADLHVGFFGANTQSEVRKTLVIREMQVTVWTRRPVP